MTPEQGGERILAYFASTAEGCPLNPVPVPYHPLG